MAGKDVKMTNVTAVTLMMTNGTQCRSVPIRYLIPSLDRAHAGQYRCIVRNRVGAIMQVTTEVQVACKFLFLFLFYFSFGNMKGGCIFLKGFSTNVNESLFCC